MLCTANSAHTVHLLVYSYSSALTVRIQTPHAPLVNLLDTGCVRCAEEDEEVKPMAAAAEAARGAQDAQDAQEMRQRAANA